MSPKSDGGAPTGASARRARPSGEAARAAEPLPADVVRDPERERASRRLASAAPGAALDRLTGLAARLLRVPSAQLSLLTDDQLVAAGTGLAPGAVGATSPLGDSLCTVTVAGRAPLVVTDARSDARVSHLLPVTVGAVGAYLGVPVAGQDGQLVGALCVFGPEPHTWSTADVEVLTELAATAAVELELSAVNADHALDRLRWELAVAAGGVGSFDWDLVTGELSWDDRMLELFGYERSSWPGSFDAFNARLHADDVDRVGRAVGVATEQCGTFEAEYRVVLPDGTTRWIHARGAAVGDGPGRARRLLGVAYDTTAGRISDARMTRVLEAMSAAFYQLDSQWRFTYVNAEAERLLGRDREELLGGVVWELFPATVGSDFERHYREAVRSGQPVAFEAYYPEPLEGWFEIRAWPSPDGLAVYFLDVTERLAAQEAAEAARARAEEASRRLELLSRVSEDLAGTLDVEAALARLTRHVVPGLGDWCVVTLVDGNGLRDIASWHVDPAMRPALERYARIRMAALTPSSFVARAIATGRVVVVPAPAAEAIAGVLTDPEATELIRALAPDTVAVIPLLGRGRTRGLITLGRGAGRPPLGQADLVVASGLAERAGLAVDNARLYGQQQRIAEGLQRALLTPPVQPDHLQVVVRYRPAAEAARVGGDWYDGFLQPDGGTVLVIGDVVGHDIVAAAAMSQLRGLLRGIAYAEGVGPAGILAGLDAAMAGLGVDTTATALVARLERPAGSPDRAVLRWSSAGHPPPVVVAGDGGVTVLGTDGNDLMLGVVPTWPRHDREVRLDDGATVLLFSDGLVEHRERTLEEGLAELSAVVTELAGAPLDDLVDGVLDRLVPDRPDDDVAVVAARLHPQDRPRPPEAGPERVPRRRPKVG